MLSCLPSSPPHLQVTHQGQVPVFYSLKSPSRSVLHVEFSGCSVRVDSVPSTQLFAMSIGIMAVQAAVGGLCSCIKKLPSSWKANSDTHEVKVKERSYTLSIYYHRGLVLGYYCVDFVMFVVVSMYMYMYINKC